MQQQRAQRRATIALAVDDALQKAAMAHGRAAAGDLTAWAEGLAEVGRAEDLLRQGEAEQALYDRVSAVRDELERGRADAEAERQLVARLEAVRSELAEHFDPRRVDRSYAEAFRAFGLDLDKVEPRQAATRLAGRPATTEIAAALDDWGTYLRGDLAHEKTTTR